MSAKITELAKKLGLQPKELRKKVAELGFEIGPRAQIIAHDLAQLIEDELGKKEPAALKDEKSQIEQYEEFYEKEIEKEIIRKQRKQTAGKDKHASKTESVSDKAERKSEIIEIPEVISVKEFSEKCAVSPAKIIGELMKNGILANINQQIDFETASIIADEFGIKLKKEHSEGSVEDMLERNLENLLREGDESLLKERAPVVSVMGHVDHGKTLLLDAIREANVVSSEAGGITQHIGAYQVVKDGREITFIDTPGHEAFTAMRARGAKATDIAILVVAVDDGVKPQTVEAYNHAREAGIPVIVALNKIDKEGVSVDRVKAELVELGLQPQEWGGDTMMIPISAMKKLGLDDLLASILLLAESINLKANPDRPAIATVLESHLDQSLGPIATVIINAGTLKVMDNVVVGSCYGRIKVMQDYTGKRLSTAKPSTPVRIAGLSAIPQMGDILQVVKDEKFARVQAVKIKALQDANEYRNRGLGLEEIASQIKTGDLKVLKVVLKTDTKGSLEAIKQSMAKIPSTNATVKIIHSGIGNISESDVLMAQASRGVVIGFNVISGLNVSKTAERGNVQVRSYKIIYELIDDVTKLLSGLLEPEEIVVELGKAEVKQIFLTKKKEMIVGCKVLEGKIQKRAKLRVFRASEQIGTGLVESLKRVNEDVSEVNEGNECGIKFIGNLKIEPGDVFEAFKVEIRTKTLSD